MKGGDAMDAVVTYDVLFALVTLLLAVFALSKSGRK